MALILSFEVTPLMCPIIVLTYTPSRWALERLFSLFLHTFFFVFLVMSILTGVRYHIVIFKLHCFDN